MLMLILANRLNTIITALIHPDQTGFMSGHRMDINIRCLHTHIAMADPKNPGMVASLDAKKAFDSVEWGYLWVVLTSFGFGLRFLSWLWMLYAHPRAHIRTLSELFSLGRGTRQGCPLSPALFALALETLAILLRSDARVQGKRVSPLKEKLSLYANDSLLYLAGASSCLHSALALFDQFN